MVCPQNGNRVLKGLIVPGRVILELPVRGARGRGAALHQELKALCAGWVPAPQGQNFGHLSVHNAQVYSNCASSTLIVRPSRSRRASGSYIIIVTSYVQPRNSFLFSVRHGNNSLNPAASDLSSSYTDCTPSMRPW